MIVQNFWHITQMLRGNLMSIGAELGPPKMDCSRQRHNNKEPKIKRSVVFNFSSRGEISMITVFLLDFKHFYYLQLAREGIIYLLHLSGITHSISCYDWQQLISLKQLSYINCYDMQLPMTTTYSVWPFELLHILTYPITVYCQLCVSVWHWM